MRTVGFITFILEFFYSRNRGPTIEALTPRTRSEAAAHADLGDSPFQIGNRVVSPGAPLAALDPAPAPADLTGLPAHAGEVDLQADAELLYRRARNLFQRRAYDLALRWFKELSNRKEARRYQADAWTMRCLFELQDRETARFLYDAPDASRDTLQVAGQFLVEHGEWEAGLAVWQRLHTGRIEQRNEASFYLTVCYLNLDRPAEAAALYSGQTGTVDALKAACDFHHARGEFAIALPLWTKLKKLSRKFGGVARAGIVDCHLELGQADEARALYAADAAPTPVLRAAAMHFYRRQDFAAARPLFERLAATNDNEAEKITAAAYTARCAGGAID